MNNRVQLPLLPHHLSATRLLLAFATLYRRMPPAESRMVFSLFTASRDGLKWMLIFDAYSKTGNPALLPIVTELIYNRISNVTAAFSGTLADRLSFCIKDKDSDWNGAFNFSGNTEFLTACIKKIKGDLSQQICTAAEMKFYFSSLLERGLSNTNFIRPNKNCNLTSWAPGCEPGWSCSAKQKVNLKDSKNMPERTQDCQTCCAGFFCPRGITCMIPCPLGSYCPLATLNHSTGICDPYNYQLPPGQKNHTCGGADLWADIGSSGEVFCSAGSHCPTTTKRISCKSGHYCRIGSTSQTNCFKLATCNSKTATQNIHAYGAILIVGLSTILLLIYTCSDQVLTTRQKRQAKSREAAARSARETAQARERWKSAKNVAKKSAIGLQAQLSRTFSRKKSTRHEPTRARGAPPLPPPPGNHPAGAQPKKKEPSNLAKMLHALEEDPESSSEGFNVEIGDKNLKKNMPKGKQMHTHSQIFKYAYGQIEKEKAMQQENSNLTFSGVISMATDTDIKARPTIEVAFKDLTLTLKAKRKHLLRCVSGKIMPGRVSAVMGPSGAGKTTFLSALAGKATGCTMSGSILVNGQVESIHSYKKIIGFVPQDDIVHGNLTVQENLRFSARCRLSADMSKPDKVLVVERVIESLGLQTVRDSLVGTVEKRGISGGQRKRVNVGLEMVMEPSLLILDEPTSGLDSSSSQLLLRALRREALEGVNICMVVHQPSYALFKTFDDLILLAKGGLTVYHGSVKKVEEYFSNLGIKVPERVNPPDHFIDILEGIVKPDSNVTHEQLPIRWMLHNGYSIPPEMLHLADTISMSSANPPPSASAPKFEPGAGGVHRSFSGGWWEDVKCNVEVKRDLIQNNFFSSSKDLSNRVTTSVSWQYRYYLGRGIKQRLRESKIQAADYLILLLAGAALGTLSDVSDETFGAQGYMYTVIAVSLLCKISALRSFSTERLEYERERSSGISSLAYFLSKDTIDHFNTAIKPLVYLSMFYFFSNPRSSFSDNYVVLLCLVYCVTGIAYVIAICFDPTPAQLWSVLLPVVLTLIATQTPDGSIVTRFGQLCYTKWALEAFVITNAERYSGVWLLTRCGSLKASGYDLHDWRLSLLLLFLSGLLTRFLAFFCLVTLQRK